MQNPYFFFDNPFIVNELMKQGIDINNINKVLPVIEKFINDVDETIKEEIEKQITELIESGEFGEIVREQFDKMSLSKTSVLDMKRTARRIYPKGTNYVLYDNQNFYNYMQGGCQFTQNGVKYDVMAFRDSESTSPLVMLRKFNHTTGILVKEYTVTGYHANSLTAFNDNIILNYLGESPTWDNPKGLMFDYNLENIKEITFPRVYQSISANDGILYGFTQNAVYQLDMSDTDNITDTLLHYFSGDVINDITLQVGCLNKDFYFLLSYDPTCIVVFSRYSGQLVWVYSIDNVIQNAWYVGEPEALQVDDNGNMVLYTVGAMCQPSLNSFYENKIFETNLYNNTVIDRKISGVLYRPSTFIQIYVRPDVTHLNPDGSFNNAFNTLQEAVNYANASEYESIDIALCGNNYSPTVIVTNKTIYIRGQVIENGSPRDPQTYDEILNNCQTGGIFIRGGMITTSNIACRHTSSASTFQLGCIQASHCQLHCYRTVYHPASITDSTLQVPVTNGLYTQYGQALVEIYQSKADFDERNPDCNQFYKGRCSDILTTSYGVITY